MDSGRGGGADDAAAPAADAPAAVAGEHGAADGLMVRYARWLQGGGQQHFNMAQTMGQMYLSISFDPSKAENLLKHEAFNTGTGLLGYLNSRIADQSGAPRPAPVDPGDTADPVAALAALTAQPQGPSQPAANDWGAVAVDVITLGQRLFEMVARQFLCGQPPPYTQEPLPLVRILVLCVELVKLLIVLRANRHLAGTLRAALSAFRRGARGRRTGIRVPAVASSPGAQGGTPPRAADVFGVLADYTCAARPFLYALALFLDRGRRPWRPWLLALLLDLAVLGITMRKSKLDANDHLRRARMRRTQALAETPSAQPSRLRISEDAGAKVAARAWAPAHLLLRDPAYAVWLKGPLERFHAMVSRIPLLGVLLGHWLQCWMLLRPLHY
eukprot:TRINITY_DN15693_c0_g1_i1.p1 TRINITY_DN15693_c0_g1~~TRINITY_DN15693_c0_g1_i1.p1  ORF type:complete len:386 (+),score=116.36 TRINITY_DN15693_c0_g1_i1:95-1252(+)